MKKLKFNNKWHVFKGFFQGRKVEFKFQSKKEYERFLFLRQEELDGEICLLKRQVPFELIPKTPGERPVKYFADFTYYPGALVSNAKIPVIVEDVKGFKTPTYIIKRKLLKYRYPDIDFREV